MLKSFSEICNVVLQNIWNSEVLRKWYLPNKLKLADITSVYKKKDPTLVENYRPVILLISVWKTFERIIQKQYSNYVGEFLSPYYCRYRKRFNTQYSFLSLIEKWKKEIDNTVYAGAILIDLSKAFDSINHQLLNAKLYAYGSLKTLWNWWIVICLIAGKEQKLTNILAFGLLFWKEYHKDQF